MTVLELRGHYRDLRDRAVALSPANEPFLRALWRVWDRDLSAFDDFDITRPYIGVLTRAITDPDLDPEAAMAWMDAYPSAVVDRLPGGLFA